MVTLQEIADKTGVSKVTVSRVLNGRIKGAWSKTAAQAQRIRDVAVQMGYRPHAAARAMVAGSFGCVGLMLSTERYRSMVEAGLLDGIARTVDEHNLHLTIAQLPDAKLTNEGFVPKVLREFMVDGLLFNYHTSIPQRMVDLVQQYRVPSVWINIQRSEDAVCPDDLGAGVWAARRLLQAGHMRLAYVDSALQASRRAGTLHYSRQSRLDGYVNTLKEAGLPVRIISDPELPTGTTRIADFVGNVRAALSAADRPTALVTYSSEESQLAREVSASLGLRMPEDLSCVTFRSERERWAAICREDSLIVPEFEMGRTAVDMLVRRIADPVRPLPSVCLPFAWYERGSIVPPESNASETNL